MRPVRTDGRTDGRTDADGADGADGRGRGREMSRQGAMDESVDPCTGVCPRAACIGVARGASSGGWDVGPVVGLRWGKHVFVHILLQIKVVRAVSLCTNLHAN